ncbi:type II toxin-antitoxin system RelE/ParE family toxin [Lonepinella koalarum]|uniref:type II toxin-antitoxin system RelE/ParE family toxin n=1 Tax=Lonepinella koalarum TaxID=53417 RepID=UPI003F6E4396
MPKLILTQKAQSNLDKIIENIVDYTGYELSGIKLSNDLYEKMELIAFMPTIGRCRDDGSLETFCRNYWIVYEIIDDIVYIETIIHCSRLYPRP